MITAPQCPRIRFRDITAEDAYLVCRWRNTDSAHDVFYNRDVVTPDTHRRFLARRQHHDLIWIVEKMPEQKPGDIFSGLLTWPPPAPEPIGMLSLTVDVEGRLGEYGRAYLDEQFRRKGYWREAERLLEHFAFETLRLDAVWLDIIESNRRMIDLHLRGGWRIGCTVQSLGARPDSLIMFLDAETYRARQAAPTLTPGMAERLGIGGVVLPAAGPGLPLRALLHQAQTEGERRDWPA